MYTYVISLTEPTDLLHNLRAHSLDAVWVPGVNGKELQGDELRAAASPVYARIGPRTSIAIGMSHIRVWETLLKSDAPYALVCEDDVILVPTFKEKFASLLAAMPADTDILALGCFGCTTRVNPISFCFGLLGKSIRPVNPLVQVPVAALGTHAYIITRKGAQILLENMHGQIYTQVDAQIQDLFTAGTIRYYAARDRIAFQSSTQSRIHGAQTANNGGGGVPALVTAYLRHIDIDDYFSADYVWNLGLLRVGEHVIPIGALATAILLAILVAAGVLRVGIALGALFVLLIADYNASRAHIRTFYGLALAGLGIGVAARRAKTTSV